MFLGVTKVELREPLPPMTTPSSGKVWATRITTGLVTFAMTMSAIGKFAQPQQMVDNFAKFHLGVSWFVPIGILELLCAILFVVRKTSSLGVLLTTGYFGAAILAHIIGDDVPGALPAIVLGSVAWVSGALRNPGTFESFSR
jgi:hypothetical protein